MTPFLLPRISNLKSETILALHNLCQIPRVGNHSVPQQQLGVDRDLARKGLLSAVKMGQNDAAEGASACPR